MVIFNTFKRIKVLYLPVALGSGGLLTIMAHMNGELTRYDGAVIASWITHGVGTLAAIVFMFTLAFFGDKEQLKVRSSAPLWAYLGGLSGALTVILISLAVNTPIALSGTTALLLLGQVIFGLVADNWGLFGLPKRLLNVKDVASILLVMSGSLIIIFFGS